MLLAFRKARKGKSKKSYVIEFEKNLEEELRRLKQELEMQSYCPRPLKRFTIRDPKTRVIHASNFRDRVVHHAICNIIEPIFNRVFISDSFANRKGKGNLAAVKRFEKFQRKVSSNGKLLYGSKDNNMIVGFALKADIKHYFDEINHGVLLQELKRKIRDEKLLNLIKIILESNSNFSGKGMPIGNLTSQLFANIYLNKFDHFVKHNLKAKYYLRYVDDFIIFHKRREVLWCYREEIKRFLEELKLELHEEKTKVYSLHKGIKFLGFRIFYFYKLPLKRNVKIIKEKIARYKMLIRQKKLSKSDAMKLVEGWNAYAKWANTFSLRDRLLLAIGSEKPF